MTLETCRSSDNGRSIGGHYYPEYKRKDKEPTSPKISTDTTFETAFKHFKDIQGSEYSGLVWGQKKVQTFLKHRWNVTAVANNRFVAQELNLQQTINDTWVEPKKTAQKMLCTREVRINTLRSTIQPDNAPTLSLMLVSDLTDTQKNSSLKSYNFIYAPETCNLTSRKQIENIWKTFEEKLAHKGLTCVAFYISTEQCPEDSPVFSLKEVRELFNSKYKVLAKSYKDTSIDLNNRNVEVIKVKIIAQKI